MSCCMCRKRKNIYYVNDAVVGGSGGRYSTSEDALPSKENITPSKPRSESRSAMPASPGHLGNGRAEHTKISISGTGRLRDETDGQATLPITRPLPNDNPHIAVNRRESESAMDVTDSNATGFVATIEHVEPLRASNTATPPAANGDVHPAEPTEPNRGATLAVEREVLSESMVIASMATPDVSVTEDSRVEVERTFAVSNENGAGDRSRIVSEERAVETSTEGEVNISVPEVSLERTVVENPSYSLAAPPVDGEHFEKTVEENVDVSVTTGGAAIDVSDAEGGAAVDAKDVTLQGVDIDKDVSVSAEVTDEEHRKRSGSGSSSSSYKSSATSVSSDDGKHATMAATAVSSTTAIVVEGEADEAVAGSYDLSNGHGIGSTEGVVAVGVSPASSEEETAVSERKTTEVPIPIHTTESETSEVSTAASYDLEGARTRETTDEIGLVSVTHTSVVHVQGGSSSDEAVATSDGMVETGHTASVNGSHVTAEPTFIPPPPPPLPLVGMETRSRSSSSSDGSDHVGEYSMNGGTVTSTTKQTTVEGNGNGVTKTVTTVTTVTSSHEPLPDSEEFEINLEEQTISYVDSSRDDTAPV